LNYARLAETARRLISSFGGRAVVTHYSVDYDAETGITTTTDNSYSLPCIIGPVNGKLIGNGTVQFGDSTATFPTDDGYSIPCFVGDKINFCGRMFTAITPATIMAPADTDIAYQAIIRRVE
jgi:hypothetical protein